jgi:hypothetical protein
MAHYELHLILLKHNNKIEADKEHICFVTMGDKLKTNDRWQPWLEGAVLVCAAIFLLLGLWLTWDKIPQ